MSPPYRQQARPLPKNQVDPVAVAEEVALMVLAVAVVVADPAEIVAVTEAEDAVAPVAVSATTAAVETRQKGVS